MNPWAEVSLALLLGLSIVQVILRAQGTLTADSRPLVKVLKIRG